MPHICGQWVVLFVLSHEPWLCFVVLIARKVFWGGKVLHWEIVHLLHLGILKRCHIPYFFSRWALSDHLFFKLFLGNIWINLSKIVGEGIVMLQFSSSLSSFTTGIFSLQLLPAFSTAAVRKIVHFYLLWRWTIIVPKFHFGRTSWIKRSTIALWFIDSHSWGCHRAWFFISFWHADTLTQTFI